MRWLRFAVFILIVTVLQAGMVDILAATRWNVKPDFLLILLVFFAIYCNTSEAIVTSFTVGFAADIIGSAMGSQTLSFGLFGTLLAYLHRVISIKKIPYQSAAIFMTGVLAGTLAYLLSLLKGQPASSNVYGVIFGSSLYSSLLGPFFFLPSAWWMRMKTPRFRRK
ncbi:MAG: rod shape-determining protein MreD [Planctomycetota bacterium]|nr:MAG: rod shape-determining protein MreD [Planctomycetota bacterium]